MNPDFAEGQSTSLRTGLEAADGEARAAVVMLGDQPGIRPDAVAAVMAAFGDGGGPVVQAAYGSRPAHPTLLARSVWAQMLDEIEGDQGARQVLQIHRSWRTLVEVGGHPPEDIDTPEDYERARLQFDRS